MAAVQISGIIEKLANTHGPFTSLLAQSLAGGRNDDQESISAPLGYHVARASLGKVFCQAKVFDRKHVLSEMCWFKSRFRHKKIPTKLLTATEERAQMEDKSIIHSADGLWTIRLTKAIKNAVTKIPGSSVAVWEAKLLKSPSEATEGDTEEAGDTEGAGEDTEEAEEATSSDGSFSPGLPSPTLHPDAIDSEEETEEDNGQTFIVKIFKVGPEGDGNRSTTEIAALETLTEAECAHAPTYLGHFENDLSPGVVRYVLMTKLPGYNLEDNSTWKLNPATVKEAFTIAIRDVHSHGVNNGSPVLRNVMWDPVGGKCYIVDFERAILGNLDDFSEDWSFFGRIKL